MHEIGREARIVALRVSVIAAFLALGKAVVGVFSGSLAVLASALDSAGDALASAVNFVFLTVASKPPDEDHQFGHGKAENLAALFEGVLIFGGSAFLIYEAVRRFGTPQQIELSLPAFLVMGVSIFASAGISRYLKANATREDSSALAADAVHYSSDVVANGATLVSMFVARFFDVPLLDTVFGVVVGLFLGVTAFRLIWDAGSDLMDRALPEDEINKIVSAIERSDEAVLGFDNLRTRRSAGVRFIDFELWIDREVTFEEAHDVTERIKRRIREVFPDAIVAVHSEPMARKNEELRMKNEELRMKN